MIREVTNKPKELEEFNNVMEMDISVIKPQCGIYFLYLKDKLQYIGKSKNITVRVYNHANITKTSLVPAKEFDRIAFIYCECDKLSDLEAKLIKKYTPPLNISGNPINEKEYRNKMSKKMVGVAKLRQEAQAFVRERERANKYTNNRYKGLKLVNIDTLYTDTNRPFTRKGGMQSYDKLFDKHNSDMNALWKKHYTQNPEIFMKRDEMRNCIVVNKTIK